MQKEFNSQRTISDVNKVVVSKKVPCNNGKDHRYTIGYKVNEQTIISPFIKTPKTYLAMVYLNMIEILPIKGNLMLLKKKSGHLSTKRSRMRLSH